MIAEWLEALVKDKEEEEAVQASMSAIQTAAAIPADIRSNKHLGNIVLTANGDWKSPDPELIFLTEEPPRREAGMLSCVHPKLTEDHETLTALKILGIRPPSPVTIFRVVAK